MTEREAFPSRRSARTRPVRADPEGSDEEVAAARKPRASGRRAAPAGATKRTVKSAAKKAAATRSGAEKAAGKKAASTKAAVSKAAVKKKAAVNKKAARAGAATSGGVGSGASRVRSRAVTASPSPSSSSPSDEAPVVAVDAMGGDKAPGEIVAGVLAAVASGHRVHLIGREPDVRPLLPSVLPVGLSFEHADDVIAMSEDPALAVRRRPGSSLVRCADAVRDGRASAMVSAGNTGAAMTAALFRIGRIPGIARPAIATPIPNPNAHPTLLVDSGATTDCDPEWLLQFALMGREFFRLCFGVDEPRVGLLSNGEEPGKGDALRKLAAPLLESAVPGYVGNVEGRDLFSDHVDVMVTDGFTGNVALKTLEGTLRQMIRLIGETMNASPETREASKVLMPGFLGIAGAYDPDNTGGALLLGIDGVCIISHGSSSARAIEVAVGLASEYVRKGIVERLGDAVTGGRHRKPLAVVVKQRAAAMAANREHREPREPRPRKRPVRLRDTGSTDETGTI